MMFSTKQFQLITSMAKIKDFTKVPTVLRDRIGVMTDKWLGDDENPAYCRVIVDQYGVGGIDEFPGCIYYFCFVLSENREFQFHALVAHRDDNQWFAKRFNDSELEMVKQSVDNDDDPIAVLQLDIVNIRSPLEFVEKYIKGN